VGEFVPGYEAASWQGVGAPAGTPASIVDTLNREINAGLADSQLKAKIEALGYSVFESSPAGLGGFAAAETDKWSKVIRTAGIKAN
jgi:tripartite-type tricarboxylate transporter receptor subunit TctC